MWREKRLVLRTMMFDALSFAGCGTLNFYQTGAAYALQQAGLTQNMKYAGASAGSGLSVLLASDVDAQAIFSTARGILEPHRGKNILRHPQLLVDFADAFLMSFITPDTLSKIGERVHISITTLLPVRNRLVNQFHDTEDLCRAIRASCHIPSLRYPTATFRGKRCIDGGFTRNNPKVGEACLRVSPYFFDPRMKISPNRLTPPWWAVVVPSHRRAQRLFEQGARDAERFIRRRKLRA